MCSLVHPTTKKSIIDYCAIRYHLTMIVSIRHKGLKRFYESGDLSGIQTKHQQQLSDRLFRLDEATQIQDINVPGWNLHPLKGKLKSRWSIKVSGNWRLTFEFREGDVHLLDYEDYH